MHSHTTFGRWHTRLAWYSIILATLLALMPRETSAGTWTALTTTPPIAVCQMRVLGDGTILAMSPDGQSARLTPDISGSYINGTWTVLSTANYGRLYFSSETLTNGNDKSLSVQDLSPVR
jgi:hypothetical protein